MTRLEFLRIRSFLSVRLSFFFCKSPALLMELRSPSEPFHLTSAPHSSKRQNSVLELYTPHVSFQLTSTPVVSVSLNSLISNLFHSILVHLKSLPVSRNSVPISEITSSKITFVFFGCSDSDLLYSFRVLHMSVGFVLRLRNDVVFYPLLLTTRYSSCGFVSS